MSRTDLLFASTITILLLSPYLYTAIRLFWENATRRTYSNKTGLNHSYNYSSALSHAIFPTLVILVTVIGSMLGNMIAVVSALIIAFMAFGLLVATDGQIVEYKKFAKTNSLEFFFGEMNYSNREMFKAVFGISPYKNASKEDFHSIKEDANLPKLAEVANLYQEYRKRLDLKMELPCVYEMTSEQKVQYRKLQKYLMDVADSLKKNAHVISASIDGDVNCKFTASQLNALKNLETMTTTSSSQKLYTDPTLEELQQIIKTPNVSASLMNEARELEKEVRKKLEEKKELLSQDESIESRLKAIKMFHNLS